MNIIFKNKLCFGLVFIASCVVVGASRGGEVSKPESLLSHDDFIWQYHFTTPSENMSPATGLVLRAINKASGKTMLRMSIGQASDRPKMIFTMHCFNPSGQMFSSSYVTDSKGQDYLRCNIEEKGQVLSSIGYYRNTSLDVDSSEELAKKSRRIQEMQLETREEALGSFPWKDLDGTVVDQMGNYVEPAPKVVETRDLDPSEEPIEPSNGELKKIIGPDAICFFTQVGYDEVANVYAISRSELDRIPSWKVEKKPPLNCEDAIAKVLEYVSALKGSTDDVYEVESVSLEQLSRKHKEKWYYRAEIRVKHAKRQSDWTQVCVLMDGTIVEPKRVDVKSIENVPTSEIDRVNISGQRPSSLEPEL